MTKRSVAIVYPKPIIGGSTTSLLGLLENIDKKSCNITLYFFDQKGPLLGVFQKIKDIEIVNLSTEKKVKLFKRINPIVWLFKIYAFFARIITRKKNVEGQIMSYCNNWFRSKVTNRKFDVAIAFLESDTSIFVSRKINANKKIAWMHVDYIKAGFLPCYDKRMYRSFNKIVTVSEECRASFAESFKKECFNIDYIPNILSPSYVLSLMEEKIDDEIEYNGTVLITTCRIDINHKGLDRAVEAFGQIKNSNTLHMKWFIIGDGPDFDIIESLIKKNNLVEDIILMGARKNPFPYYKFADFFFLPSRYEGRPMAVDEAIMCGLPCVVTDYSSAKEQIANNYNGLIIENNYNGIYNFLKKANSSEFDLIRFKKETKKVMYHNDAAVKKVGDLLND